VAEDGKTPPISAEHARDLLARERKRIEDALADVERSTQGEIEEIQTATAPEDDSEQIQEEQIDQALAQTLRRELEAVERAEARLEDGSYGFSVESGEPIPAERLEAVPWAERTIEEQKRLDGGG
jgi:DnaK suppressor protein